MQRLGFLISTYQSVGDALDVARAAQEGGFESLWSGENRIYKDALMMLTAYALSNPKMKFGTSVIDVYTRHPVLLAASALTGDNLTDGRFILGLGTSHPRYMNTFGYKIEKPIKRMRETVDIIKKAVSGQKFSYDGEFYKLKDIEMQLRPTKGDVPIYLGALRHQMIRLAGEIADGVILNHNTLEYAKLAVKEIEKGARKAGRDPKEIDVSLRILTYINNDPVERKKALKSFVAGGPGSNPFYAQMWKDSGFVREAESIVKAWEEGRSAEAANYITDEMAESFTATGTAEECRSKIEEYRKVGITLPVIVPFPTGIKKLKDDSIDVIKAFT